MEEISSASFSTEKERAQQCGVATIEIAEVSIQKRHPQLQEPAIDECEARSQSGCDDRRE